MGITIPYCYLYTFFFALLLSCSPQKEEKLFSLVPPDHSNIYYANTIKESDSIHYFNFPYIYTGAGVGIGDFNNDGLQDVFFSGNMVTPKLYLNLGDLQFKDISQQAGIVTNRWTTGVSIADVNQDGWQDIYLCASGPGSMDSRQNLLFINNHDLTFSDSAATYGLADQGHSTQAGFFDYDRDGDLDLYIMTHANETYAAISKLSTLSDGSGPSTDRLYQNTGFTADGHPFFENVSYSSGITIEGYGLGLAFSDLNLDGWPDIYIANDFIANDLLYINNKDGTFSNRLSETLKHTSLNGMGVDIADLNNDCMPDILVMDMLPEGNKRQKTMTAKMNYDYFKSTLKQEFTAQFIRNTLQLHQGTSADGRPHFSEVGRLAGIHQTDWSWAPLMADLDLDGFLDVYITNGFRRDVTNHDFQEYSRQGDVFENRTGKLSVSSIVERLLELDSVCLPNYLYQNDRAMAFTDRTTAWGMGQPSISHGSAYADFDNDGDLDLAVNNMNAYAFIYENRSVVGKRAHFLKLKLKGPMGNRNGIGSILTLRLSDGEDRRFENYPVRGYLSSSELGIHLGLPDEVQVSSIQILWSNGVRNEYVDLEIDTTYYLDYSDRSEDPMISPAKEHLFQNVSEEINLGYAHDENDHSDFRLEPLLLHLYDQYGPGIAVGDVDGNDLTDFYVGGARGQAGNLFFQTMGGSFQSRAVEGSEMYEDMGALLVDIDQDDDLDLYVVSGGSSVKYFNKGHYQDRLYLNDGKGNMIWQADALPEIRASGSCVVAADFDKDLDLDLFIGGRIVPGKFPVNPRSYLLENKDGKFYDRTKDLAPELAEIGMVSAALWSDYDNDEDFDLILSGEWMPVTLFENRNGSFSNQTTDSKLFQFTGWWNSLMGGDFDEDGDIDYIAGNQGDNIAYPVNANEPLRVYHHDFDGNSYDDAIVTRYIGGIEYPIAPRGALIDQVAAIQRAFPNYDQFSNANIHQILSAFDTSGMNILEANYLSSSYIENLGDGTFTVRALPRLAQVAPIFGIDISDYNLDGHLDAMCIGNFYGSEVISGWYDGSHGVLLLGDGNGNFIPKSGVETGFHINEDARALTNIASGPKDLLHVATINNAAPKFFRTSVESFLNLIELQPSDAWAELYGKNGTQTKVEFYKGQGYLSQAAPYLPISNLVAHVIIHDQFGNTRKIENDKIN